MQLNSKSIFLRRVHEAQLLKKISKKTANHFISVYKKFDSNIDFLNSKYLNSLIKKIIFSIPGCKPNQIIIFKKIKNSNINLTINKDS